MSTSVENPSVSKILNLKSCATKRVYTLTFSKETKSAACSRVSPDISSTILLSFPSPAPGGGPLDEGWASVVRHLRDNKTGAYERNEGDAEGTFAGRWTREKRDVEIDLLQHEAWFPEGLVRRFVTVWLCLIDHYYYSNRWRHKRRESEKSGRGEKLSANHLFWNTPPGERLALGTHVMTDTIDSGVPGHDAENPPAPEHSSIPSSQWTTRISRHVACNFGGLDI